MMLLGGSQSPLTVPRRKNELSQLSTTIAASATTPTAAAILVIDRLHLGDVRRFFAVVEGVDLGLVRTLVLRSRRRRRALVRERLAVAMALEHAQRQRRAVAGLHRVA